MPIGYVGSEVEHYEVELVTRGWNPDTQRWNIAARHIVASGVPRGVAEGEMAWFPKLRSVVGQPEGRYVAGRYVDFLDDAYMELSRDEWD